MLFYRIAVAAGYLHIAVANLGEWVNSGRSVGRSVGRVSHLERGPYYWAPRNLGACIRDWLARCYGYYGVHSIQNLTRYQVCKNMSIRVYVWAFGSIVGSDYYGRLWHP